MHLPRLAHVLLACLRLVQAQEQAALKGHDHSTKQVAIIGAGAGGASAAYHLSKFAASVGVSVNISVFERNDYIGGRTTTVNAYDDPSIPVELGGSIFVKVNTIMNDAVVAFNLSTDEQTSNVTVPGAALGVWDGEKFVFVQEGNGWWDKAKMLWRYGRTPLKTLSLMRSVVGRFVKMYEEPVFPFESLTEVAQYLDLLEVTASTGEQFLDEHGITGPFVKEIVQASTRVNYATNLKYIHGLETMVCMAVDEASSVFGGNWQIFDRMIKAASSSVHLETAVTAVKQNTKSNRLTIETYDINSDASSHGLEFDEVIIATPFQYSNLSLKSLDVETDTIPYVQLHVTLLASPHLLSPKFFSLPSNKPVPKVILTTLPDDEKPEDGPDSVGTPGFFSISLLDPVINPDTNGQEYLYKIFSSTPPDSSFLSGMLGFQRPDGDDDADIDKKDISWIFRKLWNSYPREYPRVTFEEIKLSEGLWYTSGMDSFISTMETNALMGMNVAKLIVNGWLKDEDYMRLSSDIDTPRMLPESQL